MTGIFSLSYPKSATPEFIDFWVYAPKNHLLQLLQSISANHLNIVNDILARLGVAGVELVTQTYSFKKFVVEAGLRSAYSLVRDRRYQDFQTQKRLLNALIPFLNNTDLDLRRLAAQPINEVGAWLNTDIKAKAAVISRDWNGNIVSLGEASVPFLLQALRSSLILDIRDNRGDQLKAVQSIGTIYAVNVDKKIRSLVEFLQHREESVRDATVSLLKHHQERLDQNSRYILTALDFQFCSPTTNFNFTSVAEVEGEITSTRQDQAYIQRIFQNAISSCKADATEVLNFLSLKQREYDTLLSKHIQGLESYKSRLEFQAAESLKEEISETVRFVKNSVIFVAFIAGSPIITNAIYRIAMYWWQDQSNIKYFLFGADISIGISLLILLPCLVFEYLVISLTQEKNRGTFLEMMPKPISEELVVKAFVYGIIGAIIYRLLFKTPPVLGTVLAWAFQELNFMMKFIIKKLIH